HLAPLFCIIPHRGISIRSQTASAPLSPLPRQSLLEFPAVPCRRRLALDPPIGNRPFGPTALNLAREPFAALRRFSSQIPFQNSVWTQTTCTRQPAEIALRERP